MTDNQQFNTEQGNGKSAFITGGSKGIGYAVAEALAKDGYRVTITARNAGEVEKAAQEIGGGARGVVCDVRDPEAVREAIEAHVAAFGGMDVLFANAGVGHFKPVHQLGVDEWQQMIDTNLSGVFYCVKYAAEHLGRAEGYIFTLSSLAGRNAFAGGSGYNASKFGANGFTEAMMLDVRELGIKVTQIMTGSVATHFSGHAPDPETEAWKIQPEDIAQLTVDLLHLPYRSLPSRVEVRPTRPDRK